VKGARYTSAAFHPLQASVSMLIHHLFLVFLLGCYRAGLCWMKVEITLQ
jgi:hypothetical protein